MADLDSIVNIVITRGSAQIARATLDLPLIASYHTKWSEPTREYSASTMLATLLQEGFLATDPTYLAAQAMLSQSPRPRRIKVGRLTGTWTQTYTLTPVAANATVYNGRVNDQPWTFTSDADATLAEVVTGIAAAIDALDGVTAVSAGGTAVTVTADSAATLVDVLAGSGAGVYSILDSTAAGTLGTELSVLRGQDPNWYGLVIDRTSEAAINAAATWVETARVIFAATSPDSGIVDAGTTTDVASDNLTRKRTGIFAHKDATSFFGAAMLGLMLPYAPGSATWAHKSPSGVRDPGFTASQQAAALAKKANILTTVAGLTDTQWGTSGTDFLDNVQAEDWIRATMQEDVYAFLRGSAKIPYTQRSVARLEGVIGAVLQRGVELGIIAEGSIVVDAPLVEEVSETDRANRLLPDVMFSCRLTGAIHTTNITGLVSL